MITDTLKNKFPRRPWDNFEKYALIYQDRFFKRLVSQEKRPHRLLGHNGIKYLLHTLKRSKDLYRGVIDSMNLINPPLAYLAARAHFETTSAVVYFYSFLAKFYAEGVSYEELESILKRLQLGCKSKMFKKRSPKMSDAVNGVTLVETVDKLFDTIEGKKRPEGEKLFMSFYEILSERCHPNYAALTMGCRTNGGVVDYFENLEFTDADIAHIVNAMMVSCEVFLHYYDKSFKLLRDNEETPHLISFCC